MTLLFIGLTGFRLVPLLKDELEKKGDEKKKDEKKEDESKKDEKKEGEKKKVEKKKDDSLHQTIINMLHLVPEIDGWFTQVTAIIALAETSYNGSTCAAGYIGSMWTIYVFILIVSVILPVITLVRFSCLGLEADEKRKHQFELFLYIFMWFMVAFFLIGDNSQPLDCTISGSSSTKTDNAIRIVFIILPLVTYIILVIIWIKDKIESNDSNKTHPEDNPPKEH